MRRGDGKREGVLFDYDGGNLVVVGDDHIALLEMMVIARGWGKDEA